MKSVSAVEARQGLGMLLNRVHLQNETFVIERAGKKIAILQAYPETVSEKARTPEIRIPEGKLDIRNLAGLGSEIWKDMNVDEFISGERDGWS